MEVKEKARGEKTTPKLRFVEKEEVLAFNTYKQWVLFGKIHYSDRLSPERQPDLWPLRAHFGLDLNS